MNFSNPNYKADKLREHTQKLLREGEEDGLYDDCEATFFLPPFDDGIEDRERKRSV